MDYDPSNKINKNELGRQVEITDICEFFKDFILNNRLGQISNLHVAFADSQEEGVNFIGCKKLAALVRSYIYHIFAANSYYDIKILLFLYDKIAFQSGRF
jgi:hypothetical protein